eukprot:9490967-Pyramimonas_sp.AAC.1
MAAQFRAQQDAVGRELEPARHLQFLEAVLCHCPGSPPCVRRADKVRSSEHICTGVQSEPRRICTRSFNESCWVQLSRA